MAAASSPAAWWRARPLRCRMTVYAFTFLTMVLGVLPALADGVASRWLGVRPDLGAWRAGGWVLAALALGAYAYCAAWLVRRGRGAYVEFDPPTRLVTTGPYARCRNPVALSVIGTLAGLAVARSSIGVAALAVVAALVAHAQAVWIEEPRLARRFGETYASYATAVPRWNPFGERRGPS